MIVVEGPDGSGKSTLVKAICERFDLHEGTRGTLNRDLLWTVTKSDTMRALAGMVQGSHEPRVWDRLYYSDFVYAPLSVTPRDCAFPPSVENHVEAVLASVQPPIILCLPPWSVVKANIESDRHQMDGVVERAFDIYAAYDNLEFPGWTFRYDYTTDKVASVFHHIDSYLQHRSDRT